MPALRATNPGSAASIEAIISRATERDPAARYPSVQELIADIEAVERQASSATIGMAPVSPRATPFPDKQRNRWRNKQTRALVPENPTGTAGHNPAIVLRNRKTPPPPGGGKRGFRTG